MSWDLRQSPQTSEVADRVVPSWKPSDTEADQIRLLPLSALLGVSEPLDVFDGPWTWASLGISSYATLIGYVDAQVPTATKTNEGLASNGTSSIFSYRAGTGAKRVLLVGGTHPEEMIGIAAPCRWFTVFANSQHPAVIRLRQLLTVTYVPCLVPSGYGTSRKNANDVDINRNYAFYHAAFEVTNPMFNKGAAAFSEPESQIVKAIVDRDRIACLLDCHNTGPDGDPIKFFAPSHWALGKRDLCYTAMCCWDEAYNQDDLAWGDLIPESGNPSLVSWFNWYRRWTNPSRPMLNAASIGLESRSDLLESTGASVTSGAMRAYCGMITSFVRLWLEEGHRPPAPYPIRWAAMRSAYTAAADIALADGGAKIASTSLTPIWFDTVLPRNTATAPVNEIKVVYPFPGSMVVRVSGHLVAQTENVQRVLFDIGRDGFYSDTESIVQVSVPGGANTRVPFSVQYRWPISSVAALQPEAVTVAARLVDGSTNTVGIGRISVTCEYLPNDIVQSATPRPQ